MDIRNFWVENLTSFILANNDKTIQLEPKKVKLNLLHLIDKETGIGYLEINKKIYIPKIVLNLYFLKNFSTKPVKILNSILFYYYQYFLKYSFFKKKNTTTVYYMVKLNSKTRQFKLTINDFENKTINTFTCGMLLIYNKILKKSLKKSSKSFLVFFRFLQNFITAKFKTKYFLIEFLGLTKKFLKCKAILDYLFVKNINLLGVILLPKYNFIKKKNKKLRSIKRKLLRRNWFNFKNDIKKNIKK